MKFRYLIASCTIFSLCSLSACSGGNYSRVNEKQRTPSDIKISHFHIANKSLGLRFEYRTYIDKTLEQINCKIEFNSGSSTLSVTQLPEIKLDAFSTEILNFNEVTINNAEALNNLQAINYSLSCNLNYDKGTENVYEDSVLHLVPGSQFSYR